MPAEVHVGALFREVEAGFLGVRRRSWAVKRMFKLDGQEHATIVSVDRTATRKTLALVALLDANRYELLEPQSPPSRL
jgi:hypothetical protein